MYSYPQLCLNLKVYANVQVKVGTLLHNGGYLKQSVVRLEDPAIVLSGLKEPIPRPVLDAVIRYSDVIGFLALLGRSLHWPMSLRWGQIDFVFLSSFCFIRYFLYASFCRLFYGACFVPVYLLPLFQPLLLKKYGTYLFTFRLPCRTPNCNGSAVTLSLSSCLFVGFCY